MAEYENGNKKGCLWRAEDGRCSNCKARRLRHDVLGMKEEYGECHPVKDYGTCVFFRNSAPLEK